MYKVPLDVAVADDKSRIRRGNDHEIAADLPGDFRPIRFLG
jgi:hypothetical protein